MPHQNRFFGLAAQITTSLSKLRAPFQAEETEMLNFAETGTRTSVGKNRPVYTASPRTAAKQIDAPLARKKKQPRPIFEETPNSISIEWCRIQSCSPRVQLSTIRKIVKLAVKTQKKTITIEDIAFDCSEDENNTASVLNAKNEIVRTVEKCAKPILNAKPINRLFLDSGKFGVRFYLGEEHPTDYNLLHNER